MTFYAMRARAGFALAISFLALAPLALGTTGCASKGGAKTASATATEAGAKTTEKAMTTAPAKEPDHIKVQHILIGFTGSVPGKNISRNVEEARALAYS